LAYRPIYRQECSTNFTTTTQKQTINHKVKQLMRKRDLEKLKQMLLLERQQIIENMMEIEGQSSNEISEISGDAVDIASLEISQTALTKLGSRERNLLKKIDHAL